MNKLTMNRAALFLYSLLICTSCSAEVNDLKIQNKTLYNQVASVFANLMKQAEISQVTPLKGGVSGAGVYKIVAGNQAYVLRILPKSESPNAIKREFEISVIMGELGISPKVHAYSYEKRALVMSLVKGEPIWGSHLTTEEIRSLGEKISLIHETQLSEAGRPITPEELVNRILKDVKSPPPEAYQKELDKHAANFKQLENNFALTHTDLNPGNLLKDNDGIKIIDWTDAVLTHPYLDLACVVIFYLRDSKELDLFLSSYTKGKPQDINKKELNAAYKIYNLILSLRLLNTATRTGALKLKTPTSANMKEARKVVQKKEWEKMISMLKDKDKAFAYSMVFLERSAKDLF
jgi:thiamine kinase-like enzyme